MTTTPTPSPPSKDGERGGGEKEREGEREEREGRGEGGRGQRQTDRESFNKQTNVLVLQLLFRIFAPVGFVKASLVRCDFSIFYVIY